jgi:hypothetical protein
MGHEAMQNSYQKKEFYHLRKKEKRKEEREKKERKEKSFDSSWSLPEKVLHLSQ